MRTLPPDPDRPDATPEGAVGGKVWFHTFGCQMNVYDTGKMRAQLAADGFEDAQFPEEADLILLNTCSIREKAVAKMDSALGHYRALKRDKPLVLGVAGCVAQQEGDALLRRWPELDLVFGPDGVPHVRSLVQRARTGQRVLDVDFLDLETYPFVAEVDPQATGVGAFVTIQKGCDNKCTFCIVPTTRGAEASRPSAEIVEEVRALADRGVVEITLIGQNVNSYGLKVPGEKRFAELLYAVAEVPGVRRIRYTTSHPRDMGDDVVQAYRDLPQLASHLHLPVQSGSNAVLRRMKRFYTRERYLEVVAALKAARPDLTLTTDVIVGFPGETEADFEQTMALLDEVGFVGSFSFAYSPRPGTPALRLGDPVPAEVASARLTRFQDAQRARSLAWTRSHEGTELDVLVEGPSRHDEGVIAARSSTGLMVNFPGDEALTGREVRVRVTRGFTHSARGEALHDREEGAGG
ncbi:MAG: tRNA (N6-isopentenyl adenosine(37)-C2)-methylthiotransferase MiaB [Alphaproteobacteria bacterium]|nr:tRNA (N6-isopentenyl adenosine(37)-C2)-methylthiotransferase MiaB [Alphaproteobacteria bacterium]